MKIICSKTPFSCNAVRYFLPIIRQQLKKEEPKITYGQLLETAQKNGLKGGTPMGLSNSLNLMNCFSMNILKNPNFNPAVLVVNQTTRRPGAGFYSVWGEGKYQESQLVELLFKTTEEKWQILFESLNTLNYKDHHYISAWTNT
ncbi:MAG: hypothetical protein QM523_04775 [Candidatus Pacebacteria bacterium]|nr:hypothetical protein [Candidatus Paceibacterota bacterium]